MKNQHGNQVREAVEIRKYKNFMKHFELSPLPLTNKEVVSEGLL